MQNEFLPDILEIADAHGLEKSRYKGDRGWIRYNCPFCPQYGLSRDHNGKLYLHPGAKTFNCFRCGSKGGIIPFIALLEGKHEHDVTVRLQEAYKEKQQTNGPKPLRKKKGLENHPAMQLTTRQWKLMGFTGKVTYEDIRNDPSLARRTLHWAWQEWEHYVRFQLSSVFVLYAMAQWIGDEESHRHAAEEIEKRIGVKDLWQKAEEVYQIPRRLWPKWAVIADCAAIEMYRFLKGFDQKVPFTKLSELTRYFIENEPYKLPEFPEHLGEIFPKKEAV